MFKKKPVLQYESAIDTYPDIIVPTKSVMPSWYKKINKWDNNKMFDKNIGFTHTIKSCVPFLDSLTIGYVILLPYDLYIKNNDGDPFITWRATEQNKDVGFPAVREKLSSLDLVPAGHCSTEFIWKTSVANTVPLGYSLLLTHPLNRYDLPFTTLSGVVDGGLVMSSMGSIPFFIKKDFEGIIPQGTPILQLIPFRQENWISQKTNGLVKKGNKHLKMATMIISGWYKKTFWTKKEYK
jgi:hypothetical protein